MTGLPRPGVLCPLAGAECAGVEVRETLADEKADVRRETRWLAMLGPVSSSCIDADAD